MFTLGVKNISELLFKNAIDITKERLKNLSLLRANNSLKLDLKTVEGKTCLEFILPIYKEDGTEA